MMRVSMQARRIPFIPAAVALVAFAAGSALAQGSPTTHEGEAVQIGQGTVRAVVRSDAAGAPSSIGVVFTAAMLEGLPTAAKGGSPHFPYLVPMPTRGPKTVVDHIVIDWEPAGHPPPGVYDVPHFDFHFYFVSHAEQMKVAFAGPDDSAAPAQQPPAELLPPGYVVPPGTAVPQMGVHAIDPAAAEFQKKSFTATLIYGYYNRQQIFIEPMATLAYLQSRPSFSAPVPRPANYTKPGLYPSSYGIKYDAGSQTYEVTLGDLR